MINIIREICTWGSHQYDGWVIAKAVYRCRGGSDPVSYHTQQLNSHPGYAVLATEGYGEGKQSVQCLKITLLHPSLTIKLRPDEDTASSRGTAFSRDTAIRSAGPPANRSTCLPQTISFPPDALKRFLRDSNDTNPIHFTSPAIVPGLWILERLTGLWNISAGNDATVPPDPDSSLEFCLRLMRPVYTGQSIVLACTENTISGFCNDLPCFHMKINI